MPTTSTLCLAQLPTAGPPDQKHLPIRKDKPDPLLGYVLFSRSHLWNKCSVPDPRSEQAQTEPRFWGTRGLEWQWHLQCGFLEGWVIDHVHPRAQVSTRGSLWIMVTKENLGFSLLRQQKQYCTPEGEERRGHRWGKDWWGSEAKKLGAEEEQFKMGYLLSGPAVQDSPCD